MISGNNENLNVQNNPSDVKDNSVSSTSNIYLGFASATIAQYEQEKERMVGQLQSSVTQYEQEKARMQQQLGGAQAQFEEYLRQLQSGQLLQTQQQEQQQKQSQGDQNKQKTLLNVTEKIKSPFLREVIFLTVKKFTPENSPSMGQINQGLKQASNDRKQEVVKAKALLDKVVEQKDKLVEKAKAGMGKVKKAAEQIEDKIQEKSSSPKMKP